MAANEKVEERERRGVVLEMMLDKPIITWKDCSREDAALVYDSVSGVTVFQSYDIFDGISLGGHDLFLV